MADKQITGSTLKLGPLSVPIPAWVNRAWAWVWGLPKSVLMAAGAAIFAGFVSFVLFLGFVIGSHDIFPSSIFAKVDNKLSKFASGSAAPPKLTSRTYNSGLIQLNSTVGIVPTGRPNTEKALRSNGGGLASFGNDVLVLPYTGKIFAAENADSIRQTKIAGPDNNRVEYIAAANDPANGDYHIIKSYLRYNDLTYFKSETGHGLLASYTEYHTGKLCVTNTVARLDFAPDITDIDAVEADAGDWTVVYRTKPCLPFKTRHVAMEGHMAGGRMVFQAPSTLYMTSGDFHIDGMRSEGPGIAQNPDAEYGKVMKIDIETGTGQIVSMGHRNMQGIAPSADGDIIVVEHGPKGGDEINLIREGANYGWPLESYGTTYRGGPIPNSISYGRHTQFEPPIYSWVPSIAASTMTLVDGFHDAWNGDLVVGSLRGEGLHRVRLQGQQAVYSEHIDIGTRIRAVHQHNDGRLVLWTDNEELIFMTASEPVDDSILFERYLETAHLSSRLENRLRTTIDACAECHSFLADAHENSPSLGRMFGNDIAATSFAGYSDGLKSTKGEWTRENLIAYLSNPDAFAPGSGMPNPGIEDDKMIEAVVDYLEDLDRHF